MFFFLFVLDANAVLFKLFSWGLPVGKYTSAVINLSLDLHVFQSILPCTVLEKSIGQSARCRRKATALGFCSILWAPCELGHQGSVGLGFLIWDGGEGIHHGRHTSCAAVICRLKGALPCHVSVLLSIVSCSEWRWFWAWLCSVLRGGGTRTDGHTSRCLFNKHFLLHGTWCQQAVALTISEMWCFLV